MRSHIEAEAGTRALRLMPFVLAATYLLALSVRPLVAPDEMRYAEIAREMLDRGGWIVPHFLGLRYFEKPVLGYWLNALSELAFGRTNFAARLPSALCALLTAALVGAYSARLASRRTVGTAAACMYLSMLLVFVIGTTNVLDNVLALWMTAAMVAYDAALRASGARERVLHHALFGVCCGLGFLTKGGVALAIPLVAVLPYMLWRGRLKELIAGGCIALAAAALVALPWAIAIAQREPDFWRYFVWEEHIRRFAGSNAQHTQPFWFFLFVLTVGLMPWTFALPAALRTLRERANDLQREDVVYLLSWCVMPFLFFSVARGKLATYILPCCAPLAILLAVGLTTSGGTLDLLPRLRAAAWSNVAFAVLLSLTALGATFGWGVKAPIFAPSEWLQPILLIAALLWWIARAIASLTRPEAIAWPAFASMPLALMLALPFVRPVSGATGLMPSKFVEANAGGLPPDTVFLSNSIALASTVAWTLGHEQVTLLETSGEVAYGLRYADAAGRRVAAADFSDWLERVRADHDVALFIDEDWSGPLPPADRVVRQGPITLLLYSVVPDSPTLAD